MSFYFELMPRAAKIAALFYIFVVPTLFWPAYRRFFVQLFSPPAPNSIGQHLGYLDTYRGFGALIVLGLHLMTWNAPFNDYAYQLFPPFGQGQKGVGIFLVLSAYLLWGAMARRTPTVEGIRKFLTRRFFRIYPLYLAITCWIVYHNPALWKSSPGVVVAEFLMLPTFGYPKYLNGVAWSLYLEVLFYLLLPIYWIIFANRPRASLVCSAMLAILFFLAETAEPVASPWYKYFAVGIFAFELGQWVKDQKPRIAIYYALWFLGITLVTLDFCGIYVFAERYLQYDFLREPNTIGWDYRTYYTLQMGIGVGLLCFSTEFVSLLRMPIEWFPLRFVGIVSYSLYLQQLLVIGALKLSPAPAYVEPGAIAFFFIYIPAHLFVAAITYLVVEYPFLRLGARVTPIVARAAG